MAEKFSPEEMREFLLRLASRFKDRRVGDNAEWSFVAVVPASPEEIARLRRLLVAGEDGSQHPDMLFNGVMSGIHDDHQAILVHLDAIEAEVSNNPGINRNIAAIRGLLRKGP